MCYCACVVVRDPWSIHKGLSHTLLYVGVHFQRVSVKIPTAHACWSWDTNWLPQGCCHYVVLSRGSNPSKFQSKAVLRMRSSQGHFYHPTWNYINSHISMDGVFSPQENLVNLGPLYLRQWTLVHLRYLMKRGPRYGFFTKMKIKMKSNKKSLLFFNHSFSTTPPFYFFRLPLPSFFQSGWWDHPSLLFPRPPLLWFTFCEYVSSGMTSS